MAISLLKKPLMAGDSGIAAIRLAVKGEYEDECFVEVSNSEGQVFLRRTPLQNIRFETSDLDVKPDGHNFFLSGMEEGSYMVKSHSGVSITCKDESGTEVTTAGFFKVRII